MYPGTGLGFTLVESDGDGSAWSSGLERLRKIQEQAEKVQPPPANVPAPTAPAPTAPPPAPPKEPAAPYVHVVERPVYTTVAEPAATPPPPDSEKPGVPPWAILAGLALAAFAFLR